MKQQLANFNKSESFNTSNSCIMEKSQNVYKTLHYPFNNTTLPYSYNWLISSQNYNIGLTQSTEFRPPNTLKFFIPKIDLGLTLSTIAKQCISKINKNLHMKSIFSFLFILFVVSFTFKASANNVIPSCGYNKLKSPGEAVCFQTINGSDHFLATHPTNQVRFITQDANFSYAFSDMAISLTLIPEIKQQTNTNTTENARSNSVLAVFEGINTESQLMGMKKTDAQISSASKNTKEIQKCNYPQIFYTEIYPGIDLIFRDHNNLLQYEYVVMPGFDYKEIRCRLEGAKDVFVNSSGQLSIVTEAGVIVEEAPQANQEGKLLNASWVVKGDQITISISGVDNTKELRIESFFHGDAPNKNGI